MNNYLYHHGIKGQQWGVRRYQNPDGSLTAEGIEHYKKKVNRKVLKNMYKNKKLRTTVVADENGNMIGVGVEDLKKSKKYALEQAKKPEVQKEYYKELTKYFDRSYDQFLKITKDKRTAYKIATENWFEQTGNYKKTLEVMLKKYSDRKYY